MDLTTGPSHSRRGRLWIFLLLAGVLVAGALLLWNRTQTASALIDYRIQRAFSEIRAREQRPQALQAAVEWLKSLKTRILKQEPKTRDPQQALEMLGEKAIPALAKALASDRSVAVRQIAAQVLGEIGDVSTVVFLTNAL